MADTLHHRKHIVFPAGRSIACTDNPDVIANILEHIRAREAAATSNPRALPMRPRRREPITPDAEPGPPQGSSRSGRRKTRFHAPIASLVVTATSATGTLEASLERRINQRFFGATSEPSRFGRLFVLSAGRISTPIHSHAGEYQVPRPAPCRLRCPDSTKIRKCPLRVLRLAPVTRTASAMLTRPLSRAISSIRAESSGRWPEIFNNDATLTSAVLDRLLHHAETIVLEGKSFRMKDANPES